MRAALEAEGADAPEVVSGDAGLERVTVSLDSLDDETAGAMNGRGFGVARVLDGIEAAAAIRLMACAELPVTETGKTQRRKVAQDHQPARPRAPAV